MTYIVGFKQQGMNAIIADCRVTEGEEGKNTALKIGRFFPGCIFGRCGDVEQSEKFILAFRRRIMGVDDLSPSEAWKSLAEFVPTYEFSGAHFQLLLSTRASGKPAFYMLDSREKRLIPEKSEDKLVGAFSVGSGKKVLDPYLNGEIATRYRSLVEEATKRDVDVTQDAPFWVSLWLSEWSLGEESVELHQAGVGGCFHFYGQDALEERAQPPALYIISAFDKATRLVYPYVYRVAFAAGGLFLETHEQEKPPVWKRRVTFDVASSPETRGADEDKLKQQVQESLDAQQFFYFLGTGCAYGHQRKASSVLIKSNGRKSDVFDTNGQFLPKIREMILQAGGIVPEKS